MFHNDIKADNILYDSKIKKSYLIDFGLSEEIIKGDVARTKDIDGLQRLIEGIIVNYLRLHATNLDLESTSTRFKIYKKLYYLINSWVDNATGKISVPSDVDNKFGNELNEILLEINFNKEKLNSNIGRVSLSV